MNVSQPLKVVNSGIKVTIDTIKTIHVTPHIHQMHAASEEGRVGTKTLQTS